MICHAVHCRTPALLHRRLVVLVIGLIHYNRLQNDLFRGRLLAQVADRNLGGEAALVKMGNDGPWVEVRIPGGCGRPGSGQGNGSVAPDDPAKHDRHLCISAVR